jgi:hypothetical protein
LLFNSPRDTLFVEANKENENMSEKSESKVSINKRYMYKKGGSGSIYFVGFIGALIYFIHFHSGTIWLVIIAIFKSLFWPAYLVYHLFRFLHM